MRKKCCPCPRSCSQQRLAGTGDPDRDRQSRHLARVRRRYLTRGLPVISVDAKTKEWIGPNRRCTTFIVPMPPTHRGLTVGLFRLRPNYFSATTGLIGFTNGLMPMGS
jgi:Rhodopirellula transposase DDE domain